MAASLPKLGEKRPREQPLSGSEANLSASELDAQGQSKALKARDDPETQQSAGAPLLSSVLHGDVPPRFAPMTPKDVRPKFGQLVRSNAVLTFSPILAQLGSSPWTPETPIPLVSPLRNSAPEGSQDFPASQGGAFLPVAETESQDFSAALVDLTDEPCESVDVAESQPLW